VLQRDLDETNAVGGVGRTHDDDEVGAARDLLDRDLTILGGVADVVARRILQLREPLAQTPHRLHGLVDREGRLRQPDDLRRVFDHDSVGLIGRVDDGHVLGRLTGGPFDLLVTFVTDQEDLVVAASEAHGLAVHLRHQRTRRVDRLQPSLGGRGDDGGRDPVRAEDDVRARRHLVDLLHEDGTLRFELGHDMDVVDDLLADVDGGAVALERLLDGDDGAVDARAVAAGRGEQDLLLSAHRVILEPPTRPRYAGQGQMDGGCAHPSIL
jgi:hypothetical protein